MQVIAEAKQGVRGIWSLSDADYESAAEYKRRLRSERAAAAASTGAAPTAVAAPAAAVVAY
jgi:hypothetical protein